LVAEDWPTFLYDERTGWSERNIRCGLFRGHVLMRVCLINPIIPTPGSEPSGHAQVALRLFRNKTAAQADCIDGWYDPEAKSKGPKDFLSKQNITKITPQMIAYAAIQVCTARHHCPLPTLPFVTGIRWAFIYEAVGHCGWNLQPNAPLPPHYQDTFRQY